MQEKRSDRGEDVKQTWAGKQVDDQSLVQNPTNSRNRRTNWATLKTSRFMSHVASAAAQASHQAPLVSNRDPAKALKDGVRVDTNPDRENQEQRFRKQKNGARIEYTPCL